MTSTKVVSISIPQNESVPEIIHEFSPEENYLMLTIGSECIKKGRIALAGFSQQEIYNKIKQESKEEIRQMELDIIVEKEITKKMEERISKMYEGQMDQLKKQLDLSIQQLKIYESESNEMVQKEINKAKEKYDMLLNEKDRQNQLNREVFDKAEKLISKNITKSSIAIGDDGENIFEYLSDTFKDFSEYRIENKAKQAHKGDFHLFFKDFNILVDSKNYSGVVQKKEVTKIESDLMINDNMQFAWLVSLNTDICEWNRFPITIKWINTEVGIKCIIFINNLLDNKEPKNVLRQAWFICNEFHRLTKQIDKEDGELEKLREKDFIFQKQIKNLQERACEIRRSVNSSLNTLKNMDNDLLEMLSLVSYEIVNKKFSSNDKITEWWDSCIEFVGDNSKLTSTEIWNKFKKENKEYVLENKITIDMFKDAITSVLDGSTYSEKTKKGAVEFIGFQFKPQENQNIVITKPPKIEKTPKKIDTEKLNKNNDYYFDEDRDSKILQDYDDVNKNIMHISETNNIRPWQVVSVLMHHKRISKRDDSRGYDIYKETAEYKQKLLN
jgi:hypothetical protein